MRRREEKITEKSREEVYDRVRSIELKNKADLSIKIEKDEE